MDLVRQILRRRKDTEARLVGVTWSAFVLVYKLTSTRKSNLA